MNGELIQTLAVQILEPCNEHAFEDVLHALLFATAVVIYQTQETERLGKYASELLPEILDGFKDEDASTH